MLPFSKSYFTHYSDITWKVRDHKNNTFCFQILSMLLLLDNYSTVVVYSNETFVASFIFASLICLLSANHL
jgi:hypothetical protein